MTDNKNNIFVQLYQPINQTTQSDDNGQNKPSLSPEGDPFATQQNSEYPPILEYVEPQIDESLSNHIQNANPQFIAQQNIPLAPTQTPPVPGIQPMQIPSVPLSDLEIEKELKTDVYNAIRWLAEWCLRQIQIHRPQDKTTAK